MELVFIPTPAIGHIVSHVEFAKRLLDQDDRFSVTVLVIIPVYAPYLKTYTESLAASDARLLRFVYLPQIQFTPASPELLDILCYIESHKLLVKQFIIDHVLVGSKSFAGLVVDTFTTPMIDVINELGLPSYLFNTSAAATLAAMLHLLSRHDHVGPEFQVSDTELVIPGYVKPVPVTVLENSLLLDKNEMYIYFLNLVRRFKETKAIITNSFVELESYAVKSLLEIETSTPFYMVGPLLDLHGLGSTSLCDEAQRDEIMKWLDEQPPSTVVFLCFGSLVPMDEAQVMEIAKGLEQCGHRFLLSVRIHKPNSCTNLEEILPQGFLERTRGRGLVCCWAPQVVVLAHKAIGGFVSHCGWNSILESLWYGVPILTWPMYAEQQMNAFQMVKDLGLAMEYAWEE
ncbi:hypothetical protein PTKIN_Ptkin15bG0169200 [Pterospermum kingtungense]